MKRFNWAVLLSLFSFLSAQAHAISRPTIKDDSIKLAQAGASISKSDAADRAKAKYGGKVLKVDEATNKGKKVYRVKLLLDGGRIKIITVDGRSGKII